MGLTSLQVCMETSDWLQGVNHEGNGKDSSSSPSGETMTCSQPPDKKLKPQNDQLIKCPRCESTHTKFCYYNNYSLTQPRYFCKTCRRYWTQGGSLRNIPVGGGCRKNKRVSAKKSNEKPLNPCNSSSSSHNPIDLQFSFSDAQLSHFTNLLGNTGSLGNINFMEREYNAMQENSSRQVDHFMESKFDAMLGNTRSRDTTGTNDFLGSLGDLGGTGHEFTQNFHGLCSYGNSMNENNGAFIPLGGNEDLNEVERKPNTFFSLDWQDQGCSEVRKESLGFLDCIGSWNAVMNGYGSSTRNPLM